MAVTDNQAQEGFTSGSYTLVWDGTTWDRAPGTAEYGVKVATTPGPYTFTHLSGSNVAIANRFVVSSNMKTGLYTLANTTMPTNGARLVTATVSANDAADTMGTIAVVGTKLDGSPQSENIAPVAGSTVSGAKWFKTVTSVTGSGWVAAGGADDITVGCGATCCVDDSDGTLRAIVVNTTAAGAITVADAVDTIGTLKASIAEGTYYYDVQYDNQLTVTLAHNSDVTVVHTP